MSSDEQIRASSARTEDDGPWDDARRVEGLAGETRVNLIRLIAILVFYAHHLLSTFVFADTAALPGHYHAAATAVVLGWSLVVLMVHVCVSRRLLYAWLKYAVTAADILLMTAL